MENREHPLVVKKTVDACNQQKSSLKAAIKSPRVDPSLDTCGHSSVEEKDCVDLVMEDNEGEESTLDLFTTETSTEQNEPTSDEDMPVISSDDSLLETQWLSQSTEIHQVTRRKIAWKLNASEGASWSTWEIFPRSIVLLFVDCRLVRTFGKYVNPKSFSH